MKARMENIAIVLKKPSAPENIGAAARAAKNMGIEELVLVDPYNCDLTRIYRMATHWAEDVVLNMEVHGTLEEALAPFQYVVGTTARRGSHRQTMIDPRQLAEQLVPISQKNRVALLFGPEDRGLTNKDLKYCHALVTIPTARFSSLNLAQAVMVMAYEVHMASSAPPEAFVPRLATSAELEPMYRDLTRALTLINFVNPENPDYWMTGVRRFLNRIGLRAREVKMIRGICRQIVWSCTRRTESPNAGETGGGPVKKERTGRGVTLPE